MLPCRVCKLYIGQFTVQLLRCTVPVGHCTVYSVQLVRCTGRWPPGYCSDGCVSSLLASGQIFVRIIIQSLVQVHAWFIPGPSLVHPYSIPGSSLVHPWFIPGPSLVHSWFIPCQSLVHPWFIPGPSLVPGSPLVHPWFIPGPSLVHPWSIPGLIHRNTIWSFLNLLKPKNSPAN